MDFGSIEEQLTFVIRSRDFLIGCICSSSSFFILLRAIHPLYSRLLIACQWFFEAAGECDKQSECGRAAIRIVFLSMVRDKVLLKKAGLDFWKVGVRMIKYTCGIQWISTRMCTKNTCQTWGGDIYIERAKKFKT